LKYGNLTRFRDRQNDKHDAMKPFLIDYLVCPEDSSPLRLQIDDMDGSEVITGMLYSRSGHEYPIRHGVPRFVRDDEYATTFSRQRQHVRDHFETYLREFDNAAAAKLFIDSTGFDLSHLSGLTLDAGCGYGRFLRVIHQAGGNVVGVDLSGESVELAFEFVGRAENVHIIQADLSRLPFPQCHFRRIFSIGVLHHTPSTKSSFCSLLPYLEEGGEIAIWVYAPENKVTSNRWRTITTKLPLGVVYAWCIMNEALFAPLRSLPRGGGRVGAIVPGCSLGAPFWQRIMSDFDDLTPRYAHTHSHAEVMTWFRGAGLTEVEALERATSVRGRKPNSRAISDRASGSNARPSLAPAADLPR
jgi:SAM-dependent methyltransferase